MNDWMHYRRYEGQTYRRSDFAVTRVYYQRQPKGGIDVYASGTVEGNREWMNLLPYLHSTPHDQEELESRVPAGTSIPVYLFPDLKGRTRVRVFEQTPPAEAYYKATKTALNDALLGLALTGGTIFVLLRLRRPCFDQTVTPLKGFPPIAR
jgi:hypothetical protein